MFGFVLFLVLLKKFFFFMGRNLKTDFYSTFFNTVGGLLHYSRILLQFLQVSSNNPISRMYLSNLLLKPVVLLDITAVCEGEQWVLWFVCALHEGEFFCPILNARPVSYTLLCYLVKVIFILREKSSFPYCILYGDCVLFDNVHYWCNV